ncbi:MAG: SPASM domain-containing protein [Nitrososphaeria archaeon]|jgi:MoaA/NifB/PqqE/SkfB family radical SAM enzyme
MVNGELEISTAGFCTMNCYFCPQEFYQKAYKGVKFLSLEDFKAALSNVPNDVILDFSGFNEPFINPCAVDMIEYARERGHPVDIFSTLVGLKPEDVKRLAKLNIERFTLHLPDNLGNAKIPITEEYRETLTEVLTTLRIDAFSIMNNNFKNIGRAGLSRGAKRFHKKGFFYCTHLTHSDFVMLPNCDVVLCPQDFGLKHVLGNLLKQSYMDILNSKDLKRIQRNMFTLDGDVLCRGCELAVSPFLFGRRTWLKLLLKTLSFQSS